jgi:hypothetical protein
LENGTMHYGPSSPRQRHDDRGDPSSDLRALAQRYGINPRPSPSGRSAARWPICRPAPNPDHTGLAYRGGTDDKLPSNAVSWLDANRSSPHAALNGGSSPSRGLHHDLDAVTLARRSRRSTGRKNPWLVCDAGARGCSQGPRALIAAQVDLTYGNVDQTSATLCGEVPRWLCARQAAHAQGAAHPVLAWLFAGG